MIVKFNCPYCGANSPSDGKYYDGHFGYEATVCRKCGHFCDETGWHEPDDFSLEFVNLKHLTVFYKNYRVKNKLIGVHPNLKLSVQIYDNKTKELITGALLDGATTGFELQNWAIKTINTLQL